MRPLNQCYTKEMNKTEIVVSGVNGFVGEHLAREMKRQGYAIHGLGREARPSEGVAGLLDRYTQCDLLDENSIKNISFNAVRAVIHLAGLASVSDSFNNPELYKSGNAEMTNNLLTVALDQGFDGRIVAVSTGALYDPNQPMPLSESSKTTETSPYAVGKLRAEDVIKQYRANGLDVVIARPFNHIGPGQGGGFLVADLYDQLVQAKHTRSRDILVGNLATKRDYTDVRDIVSAYTILATAQSLAYDTYNIASGVSLSGFEILNYIKEAMNLESIEPKVDQSRVRPTDAMDIIGDASRLKNELGWQITSSPEKAVYDFVVRRESGASDISETLAA